MSHLAPSCCLPVCLMESSEQSSPLRITATVRALSSALRGKRDNVPGSGDRRVPEPEKLWFKESTAKNLRSRDFLSPSTRLNTLYANGQVGPPVNTQHLVHVVLIHVSYRTHGLTEAQVWQLDAPELAATAICLPSISGIEQTAAAACGTH